MQNVVYLGRDNPIIITFSFTGEFAADGLNNFDDLQIGIGGEAYTLLTTPNSVVVQSDTELRIFIGTVTSLEAGAYDIQITGINTTYDDGYVLDGRKLGKVVVKD